jgi:peptidyl-prolyl cis-trans isomerase SurA
LRAGTAFDALAKTASNGPTAAQGGDLGEFTRGKLAPQLEQKTFSLQPDQFTEPIRTKQGFVILKVTQHNPGGDASFQSVEPQVQEALFMERMQPALRQYLTKLREEAYIEIQPGFVDSGASPNEMHPTYSAYVPPGPKKKKKFQRTRFRGRVRSANKKQIANAASSGAGVTAAKKGAGSTTQVATAQNDQNVQKAGKKEKIRFGQAPRESLPPAQNAPAAGSGNSQVATVVNPGDTHAESDIGNESQAPKQVKTRFSARPKVEKEKKAKGAASDVDKPPAPAPEEVANQKVQSAPLGLAAQPDKKKKKKEKGEKTRYSAKPKEPEQTPQPYMGNQSQPADSQPQGTGTQPKADDSQSAPKNF